MSSPEGEGNLRVKVGKPVYGYGFQVTYHPGKTFLPKDPFICGKKAGG